MKTDLAEIFRKIESFSKNISIPDPSKATNFVKGDVPAR